jgi:hypothetical protein
LDHFCIFPNSGTWKILEAGEKKREGDMGRMWRERGRSFCERRMRKVGIRTV